MRSVGIFSALMAIGLLIVLIYIWSGESIVALILSLMTLLAAAAIVEIKPWAADPEIDGATKAGPRVFDPRRGAKDSSSKDRGSKNRGKNGRGNNRSKGSDGPADRDGPPKPVWRSGFDITWDHRGVSGVALGKVAPQVWAWSQIDDVGQAWCVDQDDDERIGLCLDFPSLRNPEEPEQAQVMFGPRQNPDRIVRKLRDAWRDSKVPQSRLYDLSLEERTKALAHDLGGPELDLRTPAGAKLGSDASVTSPELLFQELRRALLAGGKLCRLSSDATFDEVVDGFDRLLEVNGAEALSRSEAEELNTADGPDRLASLHWTLDWVAEQRGFRLAFIDQSRPSAGGQDYLIGLVPAQSADDWDGQTIGSGSARVVLDLPY